MGIREWGIGNRTRVRDYSPFTKNFVIFVFFVVIDTC